MYIEVNGSFTELTYRRKKLRNQKLEISAYGVRLLGGGVWLAQQPTDGGSVLCVDGWVSASKATSTTFFGVSFRDNTAFVGDFLVEARHPA